MSMSARPRRFINRSRYDIQRLSQCACASPRLRLIGVRIGRRCWIWRIRVPRNPWDILIHEGAALDDEVTLLTTGGARKSAQNDHQAGAHMSIGFTMFDASESIEFGRDCMIGPYLLHNGSRPWNANTGLIAEQPLVLGRFGSGITSGSAQALLCSKE